jgi:hypothetical protein
MVLRLKKEDYAKPDNGEYIAELTKVETWESDKHPEYGTSIRFTFKILEEPFVNTLVSGLVSASWKPGNKLDKWLQGLGLDQSEVGTEIDSENLVGRQARVFVEEDKKSGYTNVKEVNSLRPADKSRVTAPAASNLVAKATNVVAPQVEVGTSAPIVTPPAAGRKLTGDDIPF